MPLDFETSHPGATLHGFGPFPSRRSTVVGPLGMVSSSQPLASAAGVRILERGGNAADAAIAVAAALNVTEPGANGIGGDAFCLFWDAKTRQVKAMNGSGRSPAKLTQDVLKAAGITNEIPLFSPHSVTVPGAAAMWVDARERLGSGKLSLGEILSPAIKLAENGFPVHEYSAFAWKNSYTALMTSSPNGAEMMLPNGQPPRAGDMMYMPNLAKTFRSLAEHGKDGFYKGRIAEAIVQVCQSLGGTMQMEDLEHHASVGTQDVEPISYEFGASNEGAGDGVTLHECPPNGQGLVALIALGVLDALQRTGKIPDLIKEKHNSATYLHAIVEALRFGFADAHHYVADPEHAGPDRIKALLSRAYLEERASSFDAKKVIDIKHGDPPFTSDTVYFTCADADGNACSFIQSNYAGFGSCIIPKGCGFTLANRCCTFRLQPGYVNSVGPRKRPYNTIIPAMATRRNGLGEQELFLSYGVMGGFMQPQGHVQVLLNILRGLTPQAAIDAPRMCIGAGTPDQGELDATVNLEDGIDEETGRTLQKLGHRVNHCQTWPERLVFGRGQVIMRLQNQGHASKSWVWAAGSDPRADGCAMAQIDL